MVDYITITAFGNLVYIYSIDDSAYIASNSFIVWVIYHYHNKI